MRLIRTQLTFAAGLVIGLATMWAIEAYEMVRDYQKGLWYE